MAADAWICEGDKPEVVIPQTFVTGGAMAAAATGPKGENDVIIKRLVAAVEQQLSGESPAIRSEACGRLHKVSVSSQNSPITRALLDQHLAPVPFLHAMVSFLPRRALQKNANIYLQRARFGSSADVIEERVYSYAMLMFYNAVRRGPGCESWAYDKPRASGGTERALVLSVARTLFIMECVYSPSGELVGWYLYCYDNVRPPEPKKARTRCALFAG